MIFALGMVVGVLLGLALGVWLTSDERECVGILPVRDKYGRFTKRK